MMEYLQILVVPSGLGTVLFGLGVLAMLLPRTRRLSRPFLFGSIGVLFFFSFGPVATLLLSPLEYEYPAMTEPERHGDIRTIVLLTGYASNDPDMAPSSRLSVASAFRVLETASLAQRRPDCRIVISGNAAGRRGDVVSAAGHGPASGTNRPGNRLRQHGGERRKPGGHDRR